MPWFGDAHIPQGIVSSLMLKWTDCCLGRVRAVEGSDVGCAVTVFGKVGIGQMCSKVG